MKKKLWLRSLAAVAMGFMLAGGQTVASQGGQTKGPGQAMEKAQAAEEGQAVDKGQTQEGQAVDKGQTQEGQAPMSIYYDGFLHGSGWSGRKEDNAPCAGQPGTYVTAIKAGLSNQPQGTTGTVAYQVNLSGSGWLDWAENDGQAGSTDTDMPLESVRMKLTGNLNERYDVYYAVLQGGQWSKWTSNGAGAGQEGVGKRVDGIRAAIVPKGGQPPQMEPALDPSKPMVALTFDDGPYSPVTNRILDYLEASGGKATFFMVGNRVSANQAAVKRMVALGCQVGNHTYEHKYLTRIGDGGIRSQVGLANQKIQEACGVVPVVVRPPGGFYDQASLNTLKSMGMSAIMWNIDTQDWKTRNAQKTIPAVLGHVKDGDIVLMHDIYPASADAAKVIIPELVRRGYQLVTISQLAEHRGGLEPGHVYFHFRK